MRCSIARARVLSLPAFVALLPIITASCGKLTPSGQTDDLALLRSGSDKVCVAPAVQKVLRSDVLPVVDDLPTRFSSEDRSRAIAAASITFSTTTLEGFNQAIARISCTTNATISVDAKTSKQFEVTYDVSPSADAAGGIVVTAHVDEPRKWAATMIEYQLNMQSFAQQSAAVDAEASAARARVLATVTSTWIVGSWSAGEDAAAHCSSGQAFSFLADSTMSGPGISGRWTLDGNQLHFVGNSPDRAFDVTQTITRADANSFTANNGSRDIAWQRCAPSGAEHPSPEAPASEPTTPPTN